MKGNRQSIRYWLFPFIITYLERMNKELTSYDKIATVLFKGHEEAASLLSCRELMQKDRWMLCVSKLLEDPMTADKDLIAFLMAGCDGSCEPVSQATAYRDLAAIRRLVGNVQLAGKNWPPRKVSASPGKPKTPKVSPPTRTRSVNTPAPIKKTMTLIEALGNHPALSHPMMSR